MAIPKPFFRAFFNKLSALQPGEGTWIEAVLIEGESGALRILENIPGASTEFYWRTDLEHPTRLYFYRLEKPLEAGRRTYVTPELEPYFSFLENGFWQAKP